MLGGRCVIGMPGRTEIQIEGLFVWGDSSEVNVFTAWVIFTIAVMGYECGESGRRVYDMDWMGEVANFRICSG